MLDTERALVEASAGWRLALILHSYQRLAGTALAADGHQLWSASRPVLAHGTEASPRFFYANAAALALFGMPASRLIGMESRLSAPPAHRAERSAMFTRLEQANILTGYEGVRIRGDGSPFRIREAVIWNLIDEAGLCHGQAALIGSWADLG